MIIFEFPLHRKLRIGKSADCKQYTISGNAFYQGINPFIRKNIMDKLHKDTCAIINKDKPIVIDNVDAPPLLTLEFTYYVYTKATGRKPDLDNFWIHRKYIIDSLVMCGVLIDDSIRYISKIIDLYKSTEFKEREMIQLRIYPSIL